MGAIAGAAIYASTTWVSGREWNNNDYLASVAAGAIGGGLIGTGVGLAPGLASFAAIGAGVGALSSQAGYAISSGKNYSSEEMVISASTGMVSGAIKGAVTYLNPAAAQVVNNIIDGVAGATQYALTQRYNGRRFDKDMLFESFGVGLVTMGISGITDEVLDLPVGYQGWSNIPKFNWLDSSTVKYLARAAATSKALNGILTSTVSEVANNQTHKKILQK